MTDRICCANCGAESFADTATTLYCAGCWHRLQAENVQLRSLLAQAQNVTESVTVADAIQNEAATIHTAGDES